MNLPYKILLYLLGVLTLGVCVMFNDPSGATLAIYLVLMLIVGPALYAWWTKRKQQELPDAPSTQIVPVASLAASVVQTGQLPTQEDKVIEEWLAYLKSLGVSRNDFEKHRQELSDVAGYKASINDTLWRILNSLVSKYPGDHKKLFLIYSEMAELVASEWKDPTIYLEQAARYSPNRMAFLQRHQDPIDAMILKSDEASELERSGKIDEAIEVYELLLKHQYPHPGPYERLRILYSKQKKYRQAIRACEAFIKVQKRAAPQYPEQVQKFAEWIPKLKQKATK
jgi:tetratricopeptide (TPR) repeat protein